MLLVLVSILLAGCSAVRDGSRVDRIRPSASAEELERFANAQVFFGHQSVGANILSGIEALYNTSGIPSPTVLPADQVGTEKTFLAHAAVGHNGDPRSKLAEFTALLDAGLGERVDVAVLKFCYVDVTRDSDVEAAFDEYVSAVDAIARRYPQIRLVYTTVPLSTEATWKSRLKGWATRQTPPYIADNIARQRYNTLVRARYESTGRLFDIARIESTTGDGRVSGEYSGSRYYALNDDLAADSGHLNEIGSVLAADEFIRVVAASTP